MFLGTKIQQTKGMNANIAAVMLIRKQSQKVLMYYFHDAAFKNKMHH